jgi:hypothetical protein
MSREIYNILAQAFASAQPCSLGSNRTFPGAARFIHSHPFILEEVVPNKVAKY